MGGGYALGLATRESTALPSQLHPSLALPHVKHRYSKIEEEEDEDAGSWVSESVSGSEVGSAAGSGVGSWAGSEQVARAGSGSEGELSALNANGGAATPRLRARRNQCKLDRLVLSTQPTPVKAARHYSWQPAHQWNEHQTTTSCVDRLPRRAARGGQGSDASIGGVRAVRLLILA